MKRKLFASILLIFYFVCVALYVMWFTGWFDNPILRGGKSWTELIEDKVIAMRPTRVRESATAKPTPTQNPVSKPMQIVIDKIGLDAEVIEVGIDPKTNTMEVPKDAFKAGWYREGPYPGEEGSSVITAHYDTPSGAPALFNKLKQVKAGDEFFVVDERGAKIEYVVKEAKSIPLTTFPRDLIYKDKGYSQLSLITCSGIWNPINRDYSERFVVIATLKHINNFGQMVAIEKSTEINLMQPQEMLIRAGSGKPGLTLLEDEQSYGVYLETGTEGVTVVDIFLRTNIADTDTLQISDVFSSYLIEKPHQNTVHIQLFQPQGFNPIHTLGKKILLVRIDKNVTDGIEISWNYPHTSKLYSGSDLARSQLLE